MADGKVPMNVRREMMTCPACGASVVAQFFFESSVTAEDLDRLASSMTQDGTVTINVRGELRGMRFSHDCIPKVTRDGGRGGIPTTPGTD